MPTALGFFKYCNFFLGSLADITQFLGLGEPGIVLEVILPIGISFYTFQSLACTIDVYRGKTNPTKNVWDFALHVCDFPQLVAGRIERSGHLLTQLQRPPVLSKDLFRSGCELILQGFFKKVYLADGIAPLREPDLLCTVQLS